MLARVIRAMTAMVDMLSVMAGRMMWDTESFSATISPVRMLSSTYMPVMVVGGLIPMLMRPVGAGAMPTVA